MSPQSNAQFATAWLLHTTRLFLAARRRLTGDGIPIEFPAPVRSVARADANEKAFACRQTTPIPLHIRMK